MLTKTQLENNVSMARGALDAAQAALALFEASAENNVFATLDEAEGVLEDKLRYRAFNDCEGAGNFGAPSYTQEFIVEGVHYVGTLKCEYNRHDKTYYYLEEAEFTYRPK